MPDRPFIRLRGLAHDRRHHRVHALYRELHRRLADRVRLVDVDLRCDVARGALQIVGDRPVVLVPIRLAHHVGNHWSHAAELRVTERIARPGLGEKAAVGVCGALGDHDHAIAEVADTAAHALEEFLQLERHFREQDDVRRLGLAAAGEPGRRGDPAGVSTHHLEHEHAGRGARHGGYVESRLARGDGDVLRDRAEAGTAIGVRQIVVDRLRHAHAGDGKAERGAELRHLERGVHGIVAAVIEEVANVVGAEYLDQPLIFRAVLLDALQLEARRAERPCRRVLQRPDGGGALAADVDQILGERPDDAVPSRVHLADLPLAARRLDHPARGGVDDGGDAARLGVEGIPAGDLFHGG